MLSCPSFTQSERFLQTDQLIIRLRRVEPPRVVVMTDFIRMLSGHVVVDVFKSGAVIWWAPIFRRVLLSLRRALFVLTEAHFTRVSPNHVWSWYQRGRVGFAPTRHPSYSPALSRLIEASLGVWLPQPGPSRLGLETLKDTLPHNSCLCPPGTPLARAGMMAPAGGIFL